MRNLKIFGIALMAVLATSAVAAGAASAADLTAEKYPATLTGKNTGASDVIATTAGNVSCKTTSYHGTISGPTTKISVAPIFGECTAFGFPATIDVNGCLLVFNVGAGLTGDVDLSCPAGQSMTITALAAGTAKCTAHLGSQSDIEGTANFSVAGSGTTREATVSASLKGLDYTHTKGTGIGACTAGSATNGTLSAQASVTGEEESSPFNHLGIFPS